MSYEQMVAEVAAVTEPYIRIQLADRSTKFIEQVTKRHKLTWRSPDSQRIEGWLDEHCRELYDNSGHYDGLTRLLADIGVHRDTKLSALREAISINAKVLVKERYAVAEPVKAREPQFAG